MTFHRNPYCWHELLNYLQVDPFARGQLYGLANINAVGWQEATFVLLKLIDEKTIEEACAQERKKYHDKENEDEGVRTPSKRAFAYVKTAMASHSVMQSHPHWDRYAPHTSLVRTPWSQSLLGPMNQPAFLADPVAIYRSLAGGKGIVTWPPSWLIPGAGYEPYRVGPRQHALGLLVPTRHWAPYDDGDSKGKGKGQNRDQGSRSWGNGASWHGWGSAWQSSNEWWQQS